MVIDCHGHYTTVPREAQAFRDAQIAGLLRGEAAQPSDISDDRIRESVQPQLAFQASRGTDLTIFSPRASAMGHHVGDATVNVHWAQLCNDLVHRVCTKRYIDGIQWKSAAAKAKIFELNVRKVYPRINAVVPP